MTRTRIWKALEKRHLFHSMEVLFPEYYGTDKTMEFGFSNLSLQYFPVMKEVQFLQCIAGLRQLSVVTLPGNRQLSGVRMVANQFIRQFLWLTAFYIQSFIDLFSLAVMITANKQINKQTHTHTGNCRISLSEETHTHKILPEIQLENKFNTEKNMQQMCSHRRHGDLLMKWRYCISLLLLSFSLSMNHLFFSHLINTFSSKRSCSSCMLDAPE